MISSTANAIPDKATSSRRGLCLSCSQPSGIRVESPRDLQVGQPGGRFGIIQSNGNFDDAGVFAGCRIGADFILFLDFLANAFDGAGQFLVQRRTADGGALPGFT